LPINAFCARAGNNRLIGPTDEGRIAKAAPRLSQIRQASRVDLRLLLW
jgi:hypothetical protein